MEHSLSNDHVTINDYEDSKEVGDTTLFTMAGIDSYRNSIKTSSVAILQYHCGSDKLRVWLW